MKEHKATSLPSDTILAHLRRCGGSGCGQHLANVPYHLMSMIFNQHDFDSLGSLIAFCEEPRNLKRWLPSEADRIVFSNELVQCLREMSSDLPVKSNTFATTKLPLSASSCGI